MSVNRADFKKTIDEITLLANSPKSILSAAAVVINGENKILLVKSPWRGWEIPGGQVEEHEAITSAVIREVSEESGIDIEVMKMCGIYQNVTRGICNMLFLAMPTGGEIATSNESSEVGYFEIKKALEMVTWLNFKERIEMCLDESKHPFLIEFK